jgi:hypothetical protein
MLNLTIPLDKAEGLHSPQIIMEDKLMTTETIMTTPSIGKIKRHFS